MSNSRRSLHRFWNWIKEQIIQDVPEHLAVCEFECRCVHDCRRNQCTLREEWQVRERQLRGATPLIGISIPASQVEGLERQLATERAEGVL
jgi:hypothetical protein